MDSDRRWDTCLRTGRTTLSVALLLLFISCSRSSSISAGSDSAPSLPQGRLELLTNDQAVPALIALLGEPASRGERAECLHRDFDPRPPNVWLTFAVGSVNRSAFTQTLIQAGWAVVSDLDTRDGNASVVFVKSFGSWQSKSDAIIGHGTVQVSFNASGNYDCA